MRQIGTQISALILILIFGITTATAEEVQSDITNYVPEGEIS